MAAFALGVTLFLNSFALGQLFLCDSLTFALGEQARLLSFTLSGEPGLLTLAIFDLALSHLLATYGLGFDAGGATRELGLFLGGLAARIVGFFLGGSALSLGLQTLSSTLSLELEAKLAATSIFELLAGRLAAPFFELFFGLFATQFVGFAAFGCGERLGPLFCGLLLGLGLLLGGCLALHGCVHDPVRVAVRRPLARPRRRASRSSHH